MAETRPDTGGSSAGPAGARRALVLGVLCVSLLIVALDETILNIALPTLVRQLHATESQLQWIVDVYAVVFAGLLLVAGSTGDRVGRRRVLIAGLVVFAAGSAGSAFSDSVTRLVVARGIMGVGAACIMPTTLSIIADVFRHEAERTRAIGIWSGTTGLGIAIGPIVGGWLLSRYWWGSVFLINVPIAVGGALAARAVVPESRDPVHRHIDGLGAVLSVLGLGALLWAIIEVPVRGWRSPAIELVGTVGLVLLGAFVAWERHAADPMVDLRPFADRRFSVAMASVAMAVFALMGALFVLTQYLQFALGLSALATGVRILPVAAVLAVAAPTSTVVNRLVGTKVTVALGLATVAGGLWQLSGTTAATGFSRAVVGLLLLGAGAGFVLAPATASVIGALEPDRAGVGSATNSTALQIGGAMGVAVMGSVLAARYQGLMTRALAGHPVPPAARNAILGSLGGALAVAEAAGRAAGQVLAAAARAAFDQGMDLALVVGAVAVGAAMVLVVAALPGRPGPEAAEEPDERGPLALSTGATEADNGVRSPLAPGHERSAT